MVARTDHRQQDASSFDPAARDAFKREHVAASALLLGAEQAHLDLAVRADDQRLDLGGFAEMVSSRLHDGPRQMPTLGGNEVSVHLSPQERESY